MSRYPAQGGQPIAPIATLQAWLNAPISFTPKFTLPILLLIGALLSKEGSRREHLFDQINHCEDATLLQAALLALLASAAVACQFLGEKRGALVRAVQWASPAPILGWAWWLECLHGKVVLLGVYVLGVCLWALGGRGARRKGEKAG